MPKATFEDSSGAHAHRFSPIQAIARAMGNLNGGRRVGDHARAGTADAKDQLDMFGADPRQPVRRMLSPTGAAAAVPAPMSVEASGDSVLAILNALLALNTEEAGGPQLHDVEFDLTSLLASVRDAFARQAEAKGLMLELAFLAGAAGQYRGDALRVRQILLSLISNAVKATTEGAVSIAADWRDEALWLSVADTGAGLGPERVARLMAAEDASATVVPLRRPRRQRGLATCRAAIDLMGGAMTAESTLGEGARFTVQLPLARIAVSAEPAVAASAAVPAARAPVAPLPTFEPGRRVLLAEEVGVARLVLTTLMSEMGLESVAVGDADETLAAWRQEPWDMLVIDLDAPAIAGMAVARAIRAAEVLARWPRTPILALTADGARRLTDEEIGNGFDGLVAKPVNGASLFAAIDAALNLEATGAVAMIAVA